MRGGIYLRVIILYGVTKSMNADLRVGSGELVKRVFNR